MNVYRLLSAVAYSCIHFTSKLPGIMGKDLKIAHRKCLQLNCACQLVIFYTHTYLLTYSRGVSHIGVIFVVHCLFRRDCIYIILLLFVNS